MGIKHALCQAEVAKCKQYGQGPPERSVLHGRMIPFVVEAHGKLAPMAETLTSYLITRQAKVIEEKQDVTPMAALRQVSEQFWEPLACHPLTAGWLGIAHCARGVECAACQTRRPTQPVDSQASSSFGPPHGGLPGSIRLLLTVARPRDVQLRVQLRLYNLFVYYVCT